LESAFHHVRPDSFRILLSHRPNIFRAATRHGIDLTLAGHTHGGQVAVAGRSILSLLGTTRHPWGHYQSGKSQLYTTAGAGHWAPFRLGCGTEAPVIELRRREISEI
ncbi:MAG: metallophosphoesterase, partial [bacterium]